MGTKGKTSDAKSQRQTSLLSFFDKPSATKAADSAPNKTASSCRHPPPKNPSTTAKARGQVRNRGKRKQEKNPSLPEQPLLSPPVNAVTKPIVSPDVQTSDNDTRDATNKRKKLDKAEKEDKEARPATENAQNIDNSDTQEDENDLNQEESLINNKNELDDDSSDSDEEDQPEGLSDYELLRLRNIERNNKRLASLGLLQNPIGSHHQGNKKQKQRPKKKPSRSSTIPTMPTRRSNRNRRSVLDSSNTKINFTEEDTNNLATQVSKVEEPVDEEEIFTVSPLLQYAMVKNSDDALTAGNQQHQSENLTDMPRSKDGVSLSPVGPRLIPPKGLKAIYSLDFCAPHLQSGSRTWLVGAGKAGIVALWDCNYWSSSSALTGQTHSTDENGLDPVLSWKAHSGRWVAEARFLPSIKSTNDSKNSSAAASHPPRLITAGNDGTVCCWDLSAVSVRSGVPKLLYQSGTDLHTSGIFSMDISITLGRPVIATGSKDKTVALSVLEESSSSVRTFWRSEFHSAKVSAVKLRGGNSSLLASASDNGYVCIHDYKSAERDGVVTELGHAHERPHSVVWDPGHENILMTGMTTKEMCCAYSL
jgi:hypothetical protein